MTTQEVSVKTAEALEKANLRESANVGLIPVVKQREGNSSLTAHPTGQKDSKIENIRYHKKLTLPVYDRLERKA